MKLLRILLVPITYPIFLALAVLAYILMAVTLGNVRWAWVFADYVEDYYYWISDWEYM